MEHAFELKSLAGTANDVKWASNKNERQGMIELAQHGIYCKAAQNDVVAGIERVKSWMQLKQIWFVESRVPKLIRQMKSYRWDENTSKDGQAKVERVYKVNDELPDCLRYALMTWPRPKQAAPVASTRRDLSKLPPEMAQSIEWMRKMEDRAAAPKKLDVTGDFWS
jgi:hypothetical protein